MATTTRRIIAVYECGSTEDGSEIRLNLQYDDGETEWVNIPHDKLGRIVTAINFAAGVAENKRPEKTPLGNRLPTLATLTSIQTMDTSSFPGADFIAIRVTLSPGVEVYYRLPLESIPAIQEKLAMAVDLAQSGKSSGAH